MTMAREHWFDVVTKATLPAATRREVARSVAVLLPCLLFGSAAEMAVGKGKRGTRQGGKKKKKHGAGRPDHDEPPGGVDDCAELAPVSASPEVVREWLSACREQRAQCPDDFCLYIHDWDRPDDSAAVMCCPSPKTCCHDGCFDTRNDRDRCGTSCDRCGPGQECINGTCFNPCAGQPDPWTQYCPDVRYGSPCIPADALCCGDYWCWWPGSYRCCPDQRTCRMRGDSSPCTHDGQDLP
jgi:hypothetical protein